MPFDDRPGLVGAVIVIVLLGGAGLLAYSLFMDYNEPATSSAAPALTWTGENEAVITGGNSAALDEACREQFGETWQSDIWVPNNPPTVVCSNGDGQTGYMDMPVEIQREANMVSTNQPNGTAQFVVNDRTGQYNGSGDE